MKLRGKEGYQRKQPPNLTQKYNRAFACSPEGGKTLKLKDKNKVSGNRIKSRAADPILSPLSPDGDRQTDRQIDGESSSNYPTN